MSIEIIGSRIDRVGDRYEQFYSEHHPNEHDLDAYTMRKFHEVRQGIPTWVITSFARADLERYDLVVQGARYGQVVTDADGNAAVYRHNPDESIELLETFVTSSRSGNLVSAVDLLWADAGLATT